MTSDASWPSTRLSLILRIRSESDDEAWNTFVDLYVPLIYRYCRKRGLQDADAQDVSQDVCTNVCRGIRTFEYDPARGKFRGWLGKITAHAIYHAVGKARAAGLGIGGDDTDITLDNLESSEDPQWIETFNLHIYQQGLERTRVHFSPEVWHAFELVWVQDGEPKAVALQLQQKPDWVYRAKFKVLQKLREEIEYLASDSPMLMK